MTTIVLRPEGIYADTQQTRGSSKHKISKFIKHEDSLCIGAGSLAFLQECIGNEKVIELNTKVVHGITNASYVIVTEGELPRVISRKLKEGTSNCYVKTVDTHYSLDMSLYLGSGSGFFEGAFAVSQCVETSFGVASKLDPYTNNHIELLSYSTFEITTPFA